MADSPPLILCVDDDAVGVEIRRILLERAGYSVLTALSGELGLALFQQHPVACVVLDFAMPGMNGAEVALRMRRLNPNVPILLLTAYTALPTGVTSLVDLAMTKGEGAPALLNKLQGLLHSSAS